MKPFLLYCLLLAHAAVHAQNLVANGGFEDENICTEYQKNCAPEAWIATSLYANYYFDATLTTNAARAHDGIHFLGLTAGNLRMPGMRNFIRSQLLCGLRRGHKYQLEFYIRSLHPILDSIGVYFSDQDFLYEKRYFKLINPQLWSIDGLDTTINPSVWQKVHLIYTADGSEGFITIGNFKRNEYDYNNMDRPDYKFDYYFFLDDVSLTPLDPREKLCEQADSVRNEIYRESERHQYLERKIYYKRKVPPPVTRLPQTVETKIQKIDTLIIPDIFFATASYELNPVSFHLLDSFATKLVSADIDSMVVEGHTDSIGKLAYNEALSLNRARSVKNYLGGKVPRLDSSTIIRGYAYWRPIATNKTPQGRQMNRRVEIYLYKKE